MTKQYLRCRHNVIQNGKVRRCKNKKYFDTKLCVTKFSCNKHNNDYLTYELCYIHCSKQKYNHDAIGNKLCEYSACTTCNEPVRKIIMIMRHRNNKTIIKYDYNDVEYDIKMKFSLLR